MKKNLPTNETNLTKDTAHKTKFLYDKLAVTATERSV